MSFSADPAVLPANLKPHEKQDGLLRVLLVDEDSSARAIMRDHFKDTYEILETNSAEQAIVVALERKPDALIFSKAAQGVSGATFRQTLSCLNFPAEIPIFEIGGPKSSDHTPEDGQNVGTIEYFKKPVDLEQLKARVDLILQGKKVERRREVRVQLTTTLRLRGKDKHGVVFEQSTTTENVSPNGFFCICTAVLEKDAIVEVFLGKTGNHKVGTARTMRSELKDAKNPRYGFRFEHKLKEWILS